MKFDGQTSQVYGDAAYGLRQHLRTPDKAIVKCSATLTPQTKVFNRRWVPVERPSSGLG